MSAVILKGGGTTADPSSWCVDGAGMKGVTNYVPVWERGFRGMSGYIAGRYDIPTANLEAWWALPDTWWMLNYERDPAAGLGGAPTGTAYAKDALARIRDKGHLRETALIFSFVDFGPTAAQFPVLDACHRAMVDVCLTDTQTPGAYGPPSYLRHLAAQPWWPAGGVLWQWGGGGAPEWWTTVKQAGPSSTPKIAHNLSGFGFTADENWLVTPMRGWAGYGIKPPPPQPSGDDDMIYRYSPEGYVAEIANGHKTWVTGDYFYGVVQGQLRGSGVVSGVGIYAEPAPLALIQGIPDWPAGGGGPAPRAVRIASVPGDAEVIY